MFKKNLLLCCVAVSVLIGVNSWADYKPSKPSSSEKPIAQADFSCVEDSLTTSPDGKRMACVANKGTKALIIVDGKKKRQYDGAGAIVFSPDSTRVTYVAQTGTQQFPVVSGK